MKQTDRHTYLNIDTFWGAGEEDFWLLEQGGY